MGRRSVILLVVVLALSLVGAGAASAKAPDMGDRTGDLDLSINFGAIVGAGDHQDIVWYGTVTFDEGTYGIVYRTVGTHANAVASHWTETWEMYDYHPGLFVVAEGVLIGFHPGEPIMLGADKGLTHWKNLTWVGNGPVEMANSPFEQWEGRNAHTWGVFDPVAGTGTGTIRFN